MENTLFFGFWSVSHDQEFLPKTLLRGVAHVGPVRWPLLPVKSVLEYRAIE